MPNTANRPHFQKLQYAFAAHIRDAHNLAPTGIEPRRMAIYRRLFYNNVQSLLANTYPVLHQILPTEQWHKLIRAYFAQHQATTPLFPQMPQEFLRYLENERQIQPEDPPFLYELAHYEWVELALFIDNREIELTGIDRQSDLLQGYPVLSPLAWSFVYQFPVHKVGPNYQPQEPPAEPTYLLVYRGKDDKVGFIQLNLVSAYLLQTLRDTSHTGQQILTEIATLLNHPCPQKVIQGGLEILQEWLKRDIVLGVRRI
jgi:uncharacterized protein